MIQEKMRLAVALISNGPPLVRRKQATNKLMRHPTAGIAVFGLTIVMFLTDLTTDLTDLTDLTTDLTDLTDLTTDLTDLTTELTTELTTDLTDLTDLIDLIDLIG